MWNLIIVELFLQLFALFSVQALDRNLSPKTKVIQNGTEVLWVTIDEIRTIFVRLSSQNDPADCIHLPVSALQQCREIGVLESQEGALRRRKSLSSDIEYVLPLCFLGVLLHDLLELVESFFPFVEILLSLLQSRGHGSPSYLQESWRDIMFRE